MFTTITKQVEYPTTDSKSQARPELQQHIITDSRAIVAGWYADDPGTYVGGQVFVRYKEGNARKRLAPDVFVVKNVAKNPLRDYYRIWAEGKAPDWVLDVTAKPTADDDLGKKLRIYREVWRVREYFLFDPRAEYLKPPLQGHRLRGGDYKRIKPLDGRVPSQVLALHLEKQGSRLMFFDPRRGAHLLTSRERIAEADVERAREAQARQQAEADRTREAEARQLAEAEVERLRREVEELRQRLL